MSAPNPARSPLRITALALACAGFALAGCAGAQPQTEQSPPQTGLHELDPPPPVAEAAEPERAPILPPDDAALTLVEMNIDPTVNERCGSIELPTPMFRFDSARPAPEATAYIRQLGECLAGGPLQHAEVVLIGHADPWGDEEYNRALAERRARSVARLLKAEGVASERIAIESRGERAARAQPDHWPVERRVDIAVKL